MNPQSFLLVSFKNMKFLGSTETGEKGRERSSKNRDDVFILPTQLIFQFTS